MSDSVKFIFKTLIKVPVFIVVAFLIFNVFAWVVSYFKLMGASYTVMQVAMENNYIPPDKEASIQNYLDSLENAVMKNVRIAGENTYDVRRQYGEEITIGVRADLEFVWPLMHSEQYNAGANSGTFGTKKSQSEINQARESKKSKQGLSITYTVPGLQYYPDLD